MTDKIDIRGQICQALGACQKKDDFSVAAEKLLYAMGYASDRKIDKHGTPSEFFSEFLDRAPNTVARNSLAKNAETINVIFQFTESEIRAQSNYKEVPAFDKGFVQSFMFVAVGLKTATYRRSQYAQFSREINKGFRMPVVILFRTGKERKITLSFIRRRAHKMDSDKDVLEKVSLLREISCRAPHRGHIDILEQLSFANRLEWIDQQKGISCNFDGLLEGWLDELDTDALNERFYGELLEWFNCACSRAKFPVSDTYSSDTTGHIVRLVSRILFIWFIKEKGLVSQELFRPRILETMLNTFGGRNDSYYRAILQNLFFAVLNTPIKDRRWADRNLNDEHNPALYRWRDMLAEGQDKKLEQLFAKTPFVNGGLFECLDDSKSGGGGIVSSVM